MISMNWCKSQIIPSSGFTSGLQSSQRPQSSPVQTFIPVWKKSIPDCWREKLHHTEVEGALFFSYLIDGFWSTEYKLCSNIIVELQEI